MASLYLDRRGLEGRADGDTISLYEGGEFQRRLPLHMIDRLVISAPSSVSTTLLVRCAAHNIAVVLFDPRWPANQVMLAGGASQDGRRRVAQYRAYLDPG
jgi:CRISP-associated protein Cas1